MPPSVATGGVGWSVSLIRIDPRITRRHALSTLLAPALAQAAAAPRPNIVIFLSDDMGWDQVGFNGGKEAPTPHIDAIAREGVKMTQFYVQPVCTPSRSCLMTGKWHLGEWQTGHLPRARGFEYHYGFYGALIDSFPHTREGILDWHRNGKPVVEEGYSTFLLANEASKLISNHDEKRPFFLYLPFNAVHGPNEAPPVYLKKYEHLKRAGPQRAQLECLDVAIGQVMKAIRSKGIDGNTLVMFANDNGGPERITTNEPDRGPPNPRPFTARARMPSSAPGSGSARRPSVGARWARSRSVKRSASRPRV